VRVASGRECKCLRITRVILNQCASLPTPDDKQLATAGFKLIIVCTLEGHTSSIKSLSFSPDCKLLCSSSYDESIKCWNPADGSLVKSIDEAHTSPVNSVSYSPTGVFLRVPVTTKL